MLFATQRFLGFFVVVFAAYWLLPRHRWRMLWLLLASCAFYMSWNPLLILLVLFSASSLSEVFRCRHGQGADRWWPAPRWSRL